MRCVGHEARIHLSESSSFDTCSGKAAGNGCEPPGMARTSYADSACPCRLGARGAGWRSQRPGNSRRAPSGGLRRAGGRGAGAARGRRRPGPGVHPQRPRRRVPGARAVGRALPAVRRADRTGDGADGAAGARGGRRRRPESRARAPAGDAGCRRGVRQRAELRAPAGGGPGGAAAMGRSAEDALRGLAPGRRLARVLPRVALRAGAGPADGHGPFGDAAQHPRHAGGPVPQPTGGGAAPGGVRPGGGGQHGVLRPGRQGPALRRVPGCVLLPGGAGRLRARRPGVPTGARERAVARGGGRAVARPGRRRPAAHGLRLHARAQRGTSRADGRLAVVRPTGERRVGRLPLAAAHAAPGRGERDADEPRRPRP